VFQVSRSTLSQDVVLRTSLPAPSEYGLNDATTAMELLTEWAEYSEPLSADNSVGAGGAGDSTSSTDVERTILDFGLFKIGQGKAFDQSSGEASGLDVKKYWKKYDGNRQFLIESLDYSQAQPWLQKLPKPQVHAGLSPKRKVRHEALARPVPVRPKSFQEATLSRRVRSGIMALNDSRKGASDQKGFVWDYVSTLGSSITDLTCRADWTYYISGPVTLSGNLTLEGGTVLKYAPSSSNPKLSLYSGSSTVVNCQAGMYRPIICTAIDDDTIGDQVPGSSFTPSGFYANPAISFNAVSANVAPTFSNFQVRYAKIGLELINNSVYGVAQTVRNSQFVNCEKGIRVSACTANVYNALFTSGYPWLANAAFDMLYNSVANGQHPHGQQRQLRDQRG
jgi:hypothetical protein